MKPIHAAFCLLAAPLAAEGIDPTADMLICSYQIECFETEACQDAGFSHDVDMPGALPGEATFLLDTGPAGGSAGPVGDAVVVAGVGATATYMLIVKPDGAARLSVHNADPLSVVTYHGTCRVPE